MIHGSSRYLKLRPRHGVLILLLALVGSGPKPLAGQLPTDRVHISVTLGGHFLLGVGYTHWMEQHHALEFTVFPLAWPQGGFPFGIRGGYSWVPSDEVWRAKLGGNVTLLFRPDQSGTNRFTPILNFTPGLQYDPDHDRSFRTDLWISYYLNEQVLAPTALEFLLFWPR